MRKITLTLLFFCTPILMGLSYKQCVLEFQSMRSELETKKVQCEQTKEDMDKEYQIKFEEMTARHTLEIQELKEQYEQTD